MPEGWQGAEPAPRGVPRCDPRSPVLPAAAVSSLWYFLPSIPKIISPSPAASAAHALVTLALSLLPCSGGPGGGPSWWQRAGGCGKRWVAEFPTCFLAVVFSHPCTGVTATGLFAAPPEPSAEPLQADAPVPPARALLGIPVRVRQDFPEFSALDLLTSHFTWGFARAGFSLPRE